MRGRIVAGLVVGALLAASATTAMAATARASDPLIIYAGPGSFYQPVGMLKKNEVVSLAECTQRGNWCRLAGHNPAGWVLSSYLIGAAAKVNAAPPKLFLPFGGLGRRPFP